MNTSIIILNFNDGERTAALVKKIKSYVLFDHIIVVDNLSTDNSMDILLPLRDAVTDVISSGSNGGYARGNNFGILHALKNYGSDYIFVANPDVSFTEDTAMQMVQALKDHPEYGIVAPNVRQGFNAWELPGFAGIIQSLFLVAFTLHKKRVRENIILSPEELVQTGVVEGSFFAISSKAYKAARGFDERTFLYAEEIIMARRLLAAGYKEAVLRDCYYDHLHSASIKKLYHSSKAKAFHHFRDSFRVYNRYYLHTTHFQNKVFDLAYAAALLERHIYDGVYKLLP